MNKIARLFGRRLVHIVPTMLLATVVVFVLVHLVPGDTAAALAGDYASPERIAEVTRLYGLDKPLVTQYGLWLWRALQGDLGVSLFLNQPVMEVILQRLPNTLLMGVWAFIIATVFGVSLGVISAVRPGSKVDGFVTILVSLGVAIPSFWLALLLVLNFSLRWPLFPSSGAVPFTEDPWNALYHATLPALALASSAIAETARQVRSALIEVLNSQYIRTLRAKGLSPASILWKHGLRNISATLLTVLGLKVNRLLSGAVVIEAVFAIPGVGGLIAESAIQKDYPVVQGVVLLFVVVVILSNFVADALSALLDPRVMEAA
ncbi:ABC transporter permease [Hydrogenophaga sp.]|uniref:ABC transporter permease n=1 Tax=Hydrogenophaga sp. TaxID=1904254 RepID=UPI0027203E53|nr:ABC transporter permease [Hydrogenophaga sp.]MDO9436267.1 ABC transporter permease [Hydrogenophaga sp.]